MPDGSIDEIPPYLSEPYGLDEVPADPQDAAQAPALASSVRNVDTLLAERDGIYGYYNASRRYGTESTVRALYAVAAIWHARGYLPAIGIGDISLEGGGDISGHASHETGRDVDMRPVRNDGKRERTEWTLPTYSRALTQELVDLLYANLVVRVKTIFFNDAAVEGVQNWPNHDNHLHVRFFFEDEPPLVPLATEGMSNQPHVRELQRRLNFWIGKGASALQPIVVDGDFGGKTKVAVVEFQRAHGLVDDGVAGKNTWGSTVDYIA